jgi:hypothetical protein
MHICTSSSLDVVTVALTAVIYEHVAAAYTVCQLCAHTAMVAARMHARVLLLITAF